MWYDAIHCDDPMSPMSLSTLFHWSNSGLVDQLDTCFGWMARGLGSGCEVE